MTNRPPGSFQRYLEAKKTVDDRAIHRPTFDRLRGELDSIRDGPLRILEVGAGIGTMLRRLLRWDVLDGDVLYTALDLRPANVALGRRRLREWATDRGYDVERGSPLVVRGEDATVTVEYEVADAFSFAAGDDREWDLLVGCAFLDLVEVPDALEALFARVAAGGLCYFPITFDGETVFEPTPDPEFEASVVDAYHGTMDDPDRPGGSRTGRKLFAAVDDAGADVLAGGASDWVVHPPYPHDEAFFLHYVVGTVAQAVEGVGSLDADRLDGWADDRHDAVDDEELVYLAHQLDLLCRVP